MDDLHLSQVGGGVSRRGLLKAGLGLGTAIGLSSLGLNFYFDLGDAVADGPTVPVPAKGTGPEQVHLTFGADPGTEMTVSWLGPGTAVQPTPSLSFDKGSGLVGNGRAATVVTTTFQDQMNLEVINTYHASLQGLEPATTYFYKISDGRDSIVTGTFTTAPADTARTPWRFTSFGDLATPTAHHNPSATTWNESSDNSRAAVRAIAALSPQPVVHLLNGDLCYANLNFNSQPAVWRDFLTNIEHSARSVPWMPCLGNHEIEWGTTKGNSGTLFNGRDGYGTYLSRFRLPDNGIEGLRGNFYRYQIGSVLFISLDADDVIYQDGGSYYAPPAGSGNLTAASNPAISIPPGSSTYNNQYTGGLVGGPDNTLVPAATGDHPIANRQTIWLEETLLLARQGGTTSNALYPAKLPIDMIVVQMHQCALSSSYAGNGSDLGIRQAWLPLFDDYGVDLVVSGHEHNYERSFPVRGYDPSAAGTVVAPNPGQAAAGTPVFTRLPTVVTAAEGSSGGVPAYDTSQGTVFLVLGGGGTDGPTDVFLTDADGNPQAKVITTRNLIYEEAGGTWVKNPADSVEPAPWSARRDGVDYNGTGTEPTASAYRSWGFAVFDVDPGTAAGQTVITMRYYDAPVAGGVPGAYVGSTSYRLLETVVFSHGAVTG